MSNSTEDVDFEQCYLDIINYQKKSLHWCNIPAVIIIIILSFLEKRKTLKPDLCGGRPALVSPLGFIDEPENRWGIIMVFGTCTAAVNQQWVFFLVPISIWTKLFQLYIRCMEMSVICYPLFACMTYRQKLFGSIIGLIYSIGWFCFGMYFTIEVFRCIIKGSNIDMKVSDMVFLLIQVMPAATCNFLVVLKFAWNLFKCLKKSTYKNEGIILCSSHNRTYVRNLLRKRDRSVNKNYERLNSMQMLYRKFTKTVPGFRFSISIIISSFMSVVMLFLVSLSCSQAVINVVKQHKSNLLASKIDVDLIYASNVIAAIITVLCGLRNIYLFMMHYKRDMLMMYKGDRSFIPSIVQTPSPNVYMAQGMRFIGTSIAGMVWGTILCFLLVFVPLALMMVVIRILIVTGKLKNIWSYLECLVYPIGMIIIFNVQTFLIGKYFLQPKGHVSDRHRPLAVNNRTAYDILCFFMIFLNAAIEIYTFLKRILAGAFLGVFLVPRMDRSLLMRGYESMDQCYVNYIGMLMVDVTHNHPVMRVFCSLLTVVVEKRRECKPLMLTAAYPVYGSFGSLQSASTQRCTNGPLEMGNTMSKRRWLLAYTLVRNPGLVSARRQGSPDNFNADLDDIRCMDTEEVVDNDKFDESWRFPFRCCKNYKCTIPSNIIINLMALIVLISSLFFYVGVQALLA